MSLSSFHASHVDKSPGSEIPAKRSRRRRTVSCMPCRQLKVSCDRKTPCSRCTWSKRAASCRYCSFPGHTTPRRNIQTPQNVMDSSHVGCSEESLCSRGLQTGETLEKRVSRGATHWNTLVHQFQGLLPDEVESSRLLNEYLATNPQCRQGLNGGFPSSEFPFSRSQVSISLSKTEILNHLPSRTTCDLLVSRYLATIEGTFRLFSVPSLLEEIEQLWEHDCTNISYEWFAQFFMILTLGFDATAKESKAETSKPPHGNIRETFLQMTEVCVKEISLMEPSLTVLRLLCLIVIVKQAGGFSCAEIDSCGKLADIAVKSGITLGINRPVPAGQINHSSRQIRARIWTTAVFLKVQQAVNSGSPLDLQSTDFDASVPANICDEDLEPSISIYSCGRPYSQHSESACPLLIAKSLPLAIEIVSHCNTSSEPLEPQRATLCDTGIRNLLQEASQMYCDTYQKPVFACCKRFQRSMLEIWLRRILLIIHTPNPWGYNVAVVPRPYLENCLAILVQQRLLLEGTECSATKMFAELFKQDFFVAALGACTALRHEKISAFPLNGIQQADTNAQISPRETIIQALCWCREIWAGEVYHSECNFWAHLILQRLIERI